MRRPTLSLPLFLACVFAGAAAPAAGDPARAGLADDAACAATEVHGSTVRAGRFKGAITPEYDVLDGRFRLRVGGYRDSARGLSQKIPGSVSRRVPVGTRLRIEGKRISPLPARTFRMTLARTTGSRDHQHWFFPSIIKPPAEGCWRLQFTSGRTSGTLVVLVRG
jgi:hypothetical protein